MKKNTKVFYSMASRYTAIILISLVISYIFLLHQKSALPFFGVNKGDAAGYIAIGKNIFLGVSDGVRTYGYPLFLKLIQFSYFFPSQSNPQLFSAYILVLHCLLYFSTVFLFAFSVTTAPNIRLLIISGLLLHINILSYLSVTLTETLSISILLLTCAIFFGFKKNNLRVFLLGLVAAFSVEVRPANLWVYLFIITLLVYENIENPPPKKTLLSYLIFFTLGSLVSFSPQIYYNWIHFHKITPLPAGNLAHLQFKLGKKVALVSFSLVSNTGGRIVANPFLLATHHTFSWLSLNGLSYALFKIIIIFQHNSLFVYQVMRETYQQVMVFFSSFNIYFGLLGIFLQRQRIPKEKFRAIWLGMFFCIILHLPTMLEDRFTLAIALLLFPFALYQFWIFLKQKKYWFFAFFIIFFIFENLLNGILNSLPPTYPL